MNDLISIIIPVFNVEEYLDRCVESIVNQTYSILEIILVDDGSTDACSSKCDIWESLDSRIKVIHKSNQGLGYARNTGIEASNGNYLMFVDSDDYLKKNAVEILYKRISNDKTDLAIGQFVKVYDDGSEEKSSSNWMFDSIINREKAFTLLGSTKYPLPCSANIKMYKNRIFDNLKFSALKCSEDMEIFPKIINNCEKISIVSSTVYCYYQRRDSIIHTISYEKQLDNLKATLSVGRFLLNKGFIESATTYYTGSVIKIAKMKKKKEGRLLLKETFSRKEIIQFKTKGVHFRVAQVGMYIYGIYPCFLKIVGFLKRILRR